MEVVAPALTMPSLQWYDATAAMSWQFGLDGAVLMSRGQPVLPCNIWTRGKGGSVRFHWVLQAQRGAQEMPQM
jgi:hypothetical protein